MSKNSIKIVKKYTQIDLLLSAFRVIYIHEQREQPLQEVER